MDTLFLFPFLMTFTPQKGDYYCVSYFFEYEVEDEMIHGDTCHAPTHVLLHPRHIDHKLRTSILQSDHKNLPGTSQKFIATIYHYACGAIDVILS